MPENDNSAPLSVGDLDVEVVTLETELTAAAADQGIESAVRGRRGAARKYVKWARRRDPNATPADVVALIERHYVTAISAAGAAITVGGIAAEIGIAMIPVVGPAAAGTKATLKATGKSIALGGAKMGAQKAAAMLPAGDEQLQFEITGLFALALADIHGMDLDQDQSRALVYGLSNGRVSQQQIGSMASALANSTNSGIVGVGKTIAGGRGDWGHWANTLAETLPGTAAQELVRGVQTGSLQGLRDGLTGKQQTAVEYGVGALVGGVTRFVFGREVVDASRAAFAPAPDSFPAHLAVEAKPEPGENESNRALEALEGAGKAVSAGATTGAAAVKMGVTTAASAVSRPFRSVDLDGDGIPDEAQALTAAKNVGGAVAGAAGVVGGFLSSPFKSRRSAADVAAPDEATPTVE